MTTFETAVCAECGKTITVRKDGSLRHHRSDKPEWPGSPFKRVCDGAGRFVR